MGISLLLFLVSLRYLFPFSSSFLFFSSVSHLFCFCSLFSFQFSLQLLGKSDVEEKGNVLTCVASLILTGGELLSPHYDNFMAVFFPLLNQDQHLFLRGLFSISISISLSLFLFLSLSLSLSLYFSLFYFQKSSFSSLFLFSSLTTILNNSKSNGVYRNFRGGCGKRTVFKKFYGNCSIESCWFGDC